MTGIREAMWAVIGSDAVYQSDGRQITLPQFQQLDYWLDAATRRNIDTLWLHPNAGWRWLDADIAACDPWQVIGEGGDETGAPWWTATKPRVYGVRDIVQPRYEDRAPWRDTPNARTLRNSLRAFRDAVGMDWRRSPGATGTRLLRSLHSGAHATHLELDGPPPPPAIEGVRDKGHLYFTRALLDSERGGYLHSYDVNGQYLSVCSSLALGVGAWQHLTRPTLPEKDETGKKIPLAPGYYFVKASEKAKNGPCPAILTNHTGEWVTAPTLALLREQGAICHVSECYVWYQSKRYLEPWYKALRDARAKTADPYALDAIKGLYRHAIGWLGSQKWDRSGDVLYRPDWADALQALARANVLRTVYRIAANHRAYPLAVGSDCVYYVSASPDPMAPPFVSTPAADCLGDGLRISGQLGHYKVKDAGIPVVEVADFLKGREWDLIALQHYLNVRAGRRAA